MSASGAAVVALHPEATADPHTIRWVVPAGTLPFVGAPKAVPAALQALRDGGTLTSIVVEPTAVLLSTDGDWRTLGAPVRKALAEALAEPSGWVAPAQPGSVLASAVEEVIAGEVGEYVRSHGGRARLMRVEGSVATIALDGSCSSCPARGVTLGLRFGKAVDALCPGAEVVLEENGKPLLLRWGRR
ncbi:NifU family protein [Raineyella fluvialis]|uniref:NifU family protein n=1 Tax=Raineyella fluvialis TaxID=2662261 RepID=A0A5Q2FGF4_9ACTN|nr:NifU family protein [Raineyella fluvialis]QGF23386.1 NifU family protein [Raineyella fluvialis]